MKGALLIVALLLLASAAVLHAHAGGPLTPPSNDAGTTTANKENKENTATTVTTTANTATTATKIDCEAEKKARLANAGHETLKHNPSGRFSLLRLLECVIWSGKNCHQMWTQGKVKPMNPNCAADPSKPELCYVEIEYLYRDYGTQCPKLVMLLPPSAGGGKKPGTSTTEKPATEDGKAVSSVAGDDSTPAAGGDIGTRLAAKAREWKGRSSSHGPGGGNVACAFMVNGVIADIGLEKVGSNTNYVPSMVDALKGGRGEAVPVAQAKKGALAISRGYAHVGICLTDGCTEVISNSSSARAFSWVSDSTFGNSYSSGEDPLFFNLKS